MGKNLMLYVWLFVVFGLSGIGAVGVFSLAIAADVPLWFSMLYLSIFVICGLAGTAGWYRGNKL